MNSIENDQVIPPENRQAMRNAIITQMVGILPTVAFIQGFMLLYFNALGFGASEIMVYLSFPILIEGLGLIPFAYLAERHGKKRIGMIGIALSAVGFIPVIVAAALPLAWSRPLLALGLVVFSIGLSMFNAVWFGLLAQIVPAYYRGRFFGILRFSWQSSALLFFTAVSLILPHGKPMLVFQCAMVVMMVGLLMRYPFYRRIPESAASHEPAGLWEAFQKLSQAHGFVSYCSYILLLTFFTISTPFLFALVEKKVLNMSDSLVTIIGVCFTTGSFVGYLLGGRIVDRAGTKPVFLVCHFAYGGIMFLFCGRGVFADMAMVTSVWVGLMNFLFGMVFATSSIALTTESMSIAPASHMALATATTQTLIQVGRSLSGLVCAAVGWLGVLKETWSFGRCALSSYDTILLAFAFMIVLMVITLGLVPSVVGVKHCPPVGDG